MPRIENSDRPIGVYLVALYFVLAGALETIQKYREWDGPLTFNPLGERSVWELAAHPLIYLVLAFLIWRFTALGRLGALVYGYLILGTYAVSGSIYFFYDGETPLTITPLFVIIAIYHVTSLLPLIAYLQPVRQKKIFRVSVVELLLSRE